MHWTCTSSSKAPAPHLALPCHLSVCPPFTPLTGASSHVFVRLDSSRSDPSIWMGWDHVIPFFVVVVFSPPGIWTSKGSKQKECAKAACFFFFLMGKLFDTFTDCLQNNFLLPAFQWSSNRGVAPRGPWPHIPLVHCVKLFSRR